MPFINSYQNQVKINYVKNSFSQQYFLELKKKLTKILIFCITTSSTSGTLRQIFN